jgi:hypothetical protein
MTGDMSLRLADLPPRFGGSATEDYSRGGSRIFAKSRKLLVRAQAEMYCWRADDSVPSGSGRRGLRSSGCYTQRIVGSWRRGEGSLTRAPTAGGLEQAVAARVRRRRRRRQVNTAIGRRYGDATWAFPATCRGVALHLPCREENKHNNGQPSSGGSICHASARTRARCLTCRPRSGVVKGCSGPATLRAARRRWCRLPLRNRGVTITCGMGDRSQLAARPGGKYTLTHSQDARCQLYARGHRAPVVPPATGSGGGGGGGSPTAGGWSAVRQ